MFSSYIYGPVIYACILPIVFRHTFLGHEFGSGLGRNEGKKTSKRRKDNFQEDRVPYQL